MESIVYLEDIKTVELFYLQAQMLISQVVVALFASSYFAVYLLNSFIYIFFYNKVCYLG